MLDEPHTGLDLKASVFLDKVIKEQVEKFQRLIVMVTHDIEHGLNETNQYIVLNRGKILAAGKSGETSYKEIKNLFD